jgi:hypothetical protein
VRFFCVAGAETTFGLVQCAPDGAGGVAFVSATFHDQDGTEVFPNPSDASCAEALTDLRNAGFAVLARTVIRNRTFPPGGNGNNAAATESPDILLWDLDDTVSVAHAGCNVFKGVFEIASAAASFSLTAPVIGEDCTAYVAGLIDADGTISGRSALPPDRGPGGGGPSSPTDLTEETFVVYEIIDRDEQGDPNATAVPAPTSSTSTPPPCAAGSNGRACR